MSIGTVALLIAGLVALVAGAEALVRGAARLAARTGMSSVVIGLTVVAFGTSAPELAVSVGDALRGGPEAGSIAIGNVIGSNIANILLVLGTAAAVGGALYVAQRIVRLDVPIMIGASVLVLIFVLDERLGRIEGVVLLVALIVYLTWTVIAATRGTAPAVVTEYDEALDPESLAKASVFSDIGFLILGLGLLVFGSQALVSSASDIATELGVSDLVIGLTVVAIGTSLPEVATSVLAAIRGQRDLAVGNAIGSNLFNLLAVLGVTAVISPTSIPVAASAVQVDIPVMVAVAVACLPISAMRSEERPYIARAYRDLPETGRLTGRGSTASLEGLIDVRPDLILDFGSVNDTYVSLANSVQAQTGIPYLLIDGRFDNTPAALRLVAEVLGVPERGERLAAYVEALFAEVDEAREAVPPEERPQVYLARGAAGLETALAGALNAEIIERAGGVNVADPQDARVRRGIASVSIEQVIVADPDTIVTWDPRFYASVWDDRLWAGVDAVRHQRVYLSPTTPFGWIDRPPSINRIMGLRWLSALFMPDRITIDLAEETRRFYALFYHVDLSDEALAALLSRAKGPS